MKYYEYFTDVTKYAKKLQTSEYCESGKHPIIDLGQKEIAGYTDLEEGLFTDVPAIIFGDHTRVIKYIETPFFIGADGVKVIKSIDKDADYKYIYYLLSSVRIPDTGYNRHYKWLKETILPEHNKQQQEQIVKTLTIIDNLIEKYNAQTLKLDELIKSRFVEMFGDPIINDKHYPLKRLSQIAEYWNGLTYKPDDISDNGTIVLRSSNIQNAQLDFADTVRVITKINNKKYVHCNDILMCSRNGSAKLVGKVAMIKAINEPMSFGAFMMIIRSRYYSYLFTYFQMDAFRRQIKSGATTTINQITVNMMDKVVLPVPDMELVDQFNEFVTKVEQQKAAIQKSIDRLETLKKSLMQVYFG